MGEDRVAVLLFYHTLCLKHFTNCALHELFHFHATQFWVTSVHTCSGPLKQQRLTLYMYRGGGGGGTFTCGKPYCTSDNN